MATLGGGCFWCLEAIYLEVNGVNSVESGYAGGTTPNPTYESIGNHAEVVQVKFDPQTITYREILEIFFHAHDPTQLNRQGNDVGPQYRSLILYHSPEQREIGEQIIEELTGAKHWSNPIVTKRADYQAFYKAENYHQRYYQNNPNAGYCQFVIAPKLNKFRNQFSFKLKE